jgi:hypothetical protein
MMSEQLAGRREVSNHRFAVTERRT